MSGKPLGPALRSFHRLFGKGTLVGLSDSQLLELYVSEGDSVAFEALVARHGPMVLAVCRAVLKDPNDAQDAFQATFLVLIQKAGSLWSIKGSLGSWLYRVSQRIAFRVRAEANRRRTIEIQVARTSASPTPASEPILELHEELGRLPEKFRAPIVLCHLEQLSYVQAAEQLGWTTDTVRGRLARGRDLLRSRLARRGMAFPALGGFSALFPERQSLAAVPRDWVVGTVNVAAGQAAGQVIPAGAVSAAASSLSKEVMRTMAFQGLLKIALSALIGVAALAWGASAALVDSAKSTVELAQGPAKPSKSHEPVQASPADETGTLNVRGRVVASDGNPVEGAAIYLFQRSYGGISERAISAVPPRVAMSDREGRFQFQLDKGASDWPSRREDRGWRQDKILAVVAGYGPAWFLAEMCANGKEVTLRLLRDDVPIRGRVLDNQGRPVVGATIKVTSIGIPKPGLDLDAILAASEAPPGQFETLWIPDLTELQDLPSLRTDANGRFEVRGIGRDRLVGIRIEGQGSQTLAIYAMTRPAKAPPKSRPQPSPPEGKGIMRMVGRPAPPLFGSMVDVVASPSKPIVGIVRAKGTGKPIPDAVVNGFEPVSNSHVVVISDKEGRFRLSGLPKAGSYELHVLPPPGEPWLTQQTTITDTEGLVPIETTIELLPGVLIRGRLVDKVTGESVQALEIKYLPLPSNPIHSTPRSQAGPAKISRKEKTFEMTVPPGGAMLIGSVSNYGGQFVRTRLRKEDKGKGIGSLKDKEATMIPMEAFQAYKIVEIPANARDFTVNLELIRGLSRKGKVVDPDGKPISGVLCSGLNPGWEAVQVLETDAFEARGLEPGVPRRILFAHPGRKLTGLIDLSGDLMPNLPLVQVQLHPAGTVKGRFVGEDGRPLAGLRLKIATVDLDNLSMSSSPGRATSNWPNDDVFTTDADGRFQLVGFFPGAESFIGIQEANRRYQINPALRKLKLGPGEDRDLGVVILKERRDVR